MFDVSKFTVEKARPLPVILLLDVSGSMAGESIASLNKAVNEMIESFKSEGALETEIQVAVITFGGNGANLVLPLTPAKNITSPTLTANGMTPMGAALTMAKNMLENKEIIPSKGYRPTVVLISDGAPNDAWEQPMEDFISSGRSSKCDRMAMAIGTSQDDPVLNKFLSGTENNVFLANDASGISQFFKMVTMSVSVRSRSQNPNQMVSMQQVAQIAGTIGLDADIKALNDELNF